MLMALSLWDAAERQLKALTAHPRFLPLSPCNPAKAAYPPPYIVARVGLFLLSFVAIIA